MSVFVAGVDHGIPGNGGLDCANYSTTRRRIYESIFALAFSFYQIWWSWGKLKFPKCDYVDVSPHNCQNLKCQLGDYCRREEKNLPRENITYFRRFLIGYLCLVFGVELGFKFSSRTLIYILNPCHVVTVMQIYLLLSDPRGKCVTFFFRFHIYLLGGAMLALVFPVLNTRLLPMEGHWYYVQHISILLIPYYLMTSGGSFSFEELWDPTWAVLFTGIIMVYHFFFLHLLGVLTMVNLNNMVCPAITDPFRGHYYRVCGLIHQSLYIPLHGKAYAFVGKCIQRVLTYFSQTPHSVTLTNGDVHVKNGLIPFEKCQHSD